MVAISVFPIRWLSLLKSGTCFNFSGVNYRKTANMNRFSVDISKPSLRPKESPRRRHSEDITHARPFSYVAADPPTPASSISEMVTDFDLPPCWASLSHQQLVFELLAISDAHLDRMRLFIQWVIKPATRTHRDIVLNRHQERSILKPAPTFFTPSISPVTTLNEGHDTPTSQATRFVQFIPSVSTPSPLTSMFSRRRASIASTISRRTSILSKRSIVFVLLSLF